MFKLCQLWKCNKNVFSTKSPDIKSRNRYRRLGPSELIKCENYKLQTQILLDMKESLTPCHVIIRKDNSVIIGHAIF